MLLNQQTSGYLVFDMGDKITGADEAYAVTSTDKQVGPIARSVLQIVRAEKDDDGYAPDDTQVYYGQIPVSIRQRNE